MSKTCTWAVRVDWTGPRINEADAIEILDALADIHPALTTDTDDLDAHRTHYARHSVTVRLEAASLRQAAAAALQRVEAATSTKAAGCETLLWHELQRQLQQPTIPALVGHAEIAEMLGVSRQRAAQLADREDFPPAVQTLKAGPLRIKSQVEAWVAQWERKTGRPKVNA